MRMATTLCRSLGAILGCHSAGTAKLARSCKRRLCWPRRRRRPMPKSIPRWRATSAGADAISAFTRRCVPPPRGCDMTYHQPSNTITISNVSRRGVLKGLGVTGGFVLAAQFPATRAAFAYATGAEGMPHGVVNDPRIFVSIEPNGVVTILAARAEMGTGAARTALPMILADEMGCDWERVHVKQAPGNEEKYGNQDTDGSRSVRHWIQDRKST